MMKPQTPSVWLQASFGLAAWLWLAPGADALPTYTSIPLDLPTPQADARFAEAVAGIGDVNGDGASDFVVGAPFFQILGNLNQGRVFIFSGADRRLLLTLEHPAPQGLALFGSAVTGVGDVNRDGRPDFLVGAPSQTVGGRTNQGQAYVFSGPDGRLLLTLDNPFPRMDAAFGAVLAGAGDVNGDGAPDLLAGVPGEGQAFVFSGADASLLLALDGPPSPSQGFALFGQHVAGAGDVNGDGAPDLLVGTGLGGQAFVFSGSDASVLLTLDTPTPASFAGFGEVVAGIGDVDGDSAPDFLMGAPGQSVGGRFRQGRAFVVLSVPLGLARTRFPCTIRRCRVSARCDLSASLGTPCTNRIDVRVRVPRRLAQDVAVQGQRRLRLFAVSTATSVPPGQTRPVRLRLTPQGRRIFMNSRAKRLTGVAEIRNTPGTVIDTIEVRIRLRRR